MAIYNKKITRYLDSTKVSVYNKPIVSGQKKDSEVKPRRQGTSSKHSQSVSLNRTKNAIYDLARSNEWDWFITLTFDSALINSTDYDSVVSCIKKFIDSMRKTYAPDLVYLFVPEFHSDMCKFHFHGLIKNTGSMSFLPTGICDNSGRQIFSVGNWIYGFSNATCIEDSHRVTSYITKYITKDCMIHTKNKRRYLCSKNINRPIVEKINTPDTVLDIINTCNPSYISSTSVPAAYQKITYMEIDDK